MSREPLPPFGVVEGGFAVRLTDDEASMLKRLIAELRQLLTASTDDETELLTRLFPTAHPDDPAAEAEYQRLMRDDLVESKLASIETVESMLDRRADDQVASEADLVAWMQAINSIRLVLGTMLAVSDDPDEPEVMPGFERSQEYHLYGYLSWLLDSAVQAVSGR